MFYPSRLIFYLYFAIQLLICGLFLIEYQEKRREENEDKAYCGYRSRYWYVLYRGMMMCVCDGMYVRDRETIFLAISMPFVNTGKDLKKKKNYVDVFVCGSSGVDGILMIWMYGMEVHQVL